ncbi:tyrosine-type recombinase/integrase [Actinoplanes sp. NEAU-H7]|uniref:Tyrosine-type recombinase/integrase n=1 Tax=Actinoplanes flavus TaxID=2820290 RepID=A0ABS3UD66_9ACTN|nr:tyrosine-type recombinase/integrase [Actinoplanes flavus]
MQRFVNYCRARRLSSLFDLGADDEGKSRLNTIIRMIRFEAVNGLRCIYYSPADTKAAGFIETSHFGRQFTGCQSHFDISEVSQRWLRDLLWEHLAGLLRSPDCPRGRYVFDSYRRACVEFSRFLAVEAEDHGDDPRLLRREHAERFVADQRHRQRHGLPSLAVTNRAGVPSTVTDETRRAVFNHLRKLLFGALDSGAATDLGLCPTFITAIPFGGPDRKQSRSPFSDEVARALADETNLREFASAHDPNDRGMRDVWEAIIYTGRRCSEIVTLRLDCLGRYGDLPMLWHDQTKVGNYNEAIRIPEVLYTRLEQRAAKTQLRFEQRHGRPPTPAERGKIALFPSGIRNPRDERSISYGHFHRSFRVWVERLDLGSCVPHQARHTLATNLLRAGASLAHIRRYLGHLSERMAEHYTKIAHSDLEDVLHTVWVAGPGAANPGEPLSSPTSQPLNRDEAMALALDLSRRSTPAEGGFCTFQPVVNGDACPWQLNCHTCDKFVLSGADLLYWRRKQQQWRSIAERAPDDATADYLHQVFEPTARAIDGLEKVLAGLGLLDEALALDLRRPQDYFRRLWSTNFRATDLAAVAERPDPDLGER